MFKKYLLAILFFSLLLSCNKDDKSVPTKGDLEGISYNPDAYALSVPDGFRDMIIPEDNLLTNQGIFLGRKLFYDPILSGDNTMSCASCHFATASFTDHLATSKGIDGINGKRSAMSLLNVGYNDKGFFWDGRSTTLEEQALMPVEDPIELHADWGDVVAKIRKHSSYPAEFRKAFGIKDRKEITKELVAKALAQFERTLVSSGNSKFDRAFRGETFLTPAELNGMDMFFDQSDVLPDAECGHCHNKPLFTTNKYINNGIDLANDLNDFEDWGYGAITGKKSDNGKFKIPSLRNIALTAPYMHDGRFNTLEEVIEHYNAGGKYAENRHPLILNLQLTEVQKSELIAFLHTLTDTSFVNNPKFSNPF